MPISSATIQIAKPFVFTWGDGLTDDTMQKICHNFTPNLNGDLTGNNLIDALEKARQQALIATFSSTEPRTLSYARESMKLALYTYAELCGYSIQNNNTTIIPNMKLTNEPFVFSWNPDLKSDIVNSFCWLFGKELNKIPEASDDTTSLKSKIEELREKSLEKVFREKCGNPDYISLSDQIAVIAFAIRLGHKDITTYEEASEVIGLKNLGKSTPRSSNGIVSLTTPTAVANHAKLGAKLIPTETKDILALGHRAGNGIYGRYNLPTVYNFLIASPVPPAKKPASITKQVDIPNYTFLTIEDGKLVGSGKFLRIAGYACIFLDKKNQEQSAPFFNTALIVREIKPEQIDKGSLTEQGTLKTFNPFTDGADAMNDFSKDSILEITIDNDKPVIGTYFAYHVSGYKDLVIWLKDGRCISARNNEVTIQAFKNKE